MTVYTWLVVLLLLAALFLRGDRRDNEKFIIVAFLLLFIVMGLRNVNSVGLDSSGTHGSYPGSFRTAGITSWSRLSGRGGDSFNIGFVYLTKLLYIITDGNYQMYITLLSFFIMVSYMRFIMRYSPSPIQSVLYFLGLLYFTFLFDALKQAIAMSVLLYAIDAIMEKRPVKYLLLVLIAGLLHFPALIFLPAYWIGRMKIGRNYLFLLAILLVTTFIFRNQILRLMLRTYGGEDIERSMEGIRFLRNKAIVMIIIVVAAVILRPPTEGDTMYNACLIFTGIAIVFQTFCGYNNIFERLADYYFHTSIVFIPLVFEKYEHRRQLLDLRTEMLIKNLAPVIFCSFAIWRFLSIVNNSAHYNGFRFFWQ